MNYTNAPSTYYVKYLEQQLPAIEKKLHGLINNFKFEKYQMDDIFQDILVKALEKIHTFRGKSKLETWIYSIAINYCINYKKRKQELSVDYIDTLYEKQSGDNCPLSDAYIKKDLHKRINRIIKNLPPKFRSIISLYYFENVRQEQIAERLGIPLGTVWSRMNTVKNMLRTQLADYYECAG